MSHCYVQDVHAYSCTLSFRLRMKVYITYFSGSLKKVLQFLFFVVAFEISTIENMQRKIF